MLADEVDVVIGVDTHRDAHSLGVVAAPSGAVIHETRVEASASGYRRALAEVERCGPGSRAWAVEGSGGYGAGLVRFLAARGERVIEIDRPERRAERTQAKSDPLDALRAARTALGRAKLAAPRAGAGREALRVLMVTRSGAVGVRCQAIRQLKALIVTAPDDLRAPAAPRRHDPPGPLRDPAPPGGSCRPGSEGHRGRPAGAGTQGALGRR